MNTITSFRLLFLSLILIISSSNLQAQEEDKGILYKDHIYLSNIRTVTLHPKTNPVDYPILTLNAQNNLIDTLQLGFDDLAEDISSYVYTVQLCDKNWKPSDLATSQYIRGYENENIDNYEASSATITPYVHYQLEIPNENFQLLTSGNYLLKVYEDEEERRLAFTKRFLVVQPKYKVEAGLVPTFDIKKRYTHHEIDFLIDHENQTINNPIATITATVLQNYRWDSAIENVAPILLKNEKVIFDYSDKIVFGGLREFRQLDNRSFDDRSIEVKNIERFSDGIFVEQKPEEKRKFTVYNYRFGDFDGSFIIQNKDDVPHLDIPQKEFLLETSNLFSDKLHHTAGDYSINQFILNYPEKIENADVYIYGGFTNYELLDEYKMNYNSEKARYEGTCLLKQGFYEYLYAVVDRDEGTIDLEIMEPSLFETENKYLILIYYTPFGAQNDLLITAKTINSSID